MKHDQPTDETKELAALYALGALEPAEAASFERHMQDGCASCQAELSTFQNVVGDLGQTTFEEAPPNTLRSKVLAAMMDEAQDSASTSFADTLHSAAKTLESVLVRAAEGIWQNVMPGLQAKFLGHFPCVLH